MEEKARDAIEPAAEDGAAFEPADESFAADASAFAEGIGRKATRKLRARRRKRPVWGSLGLMGTVGWSVAIPTVVGVFLGRWLDASYPDAERSWTLVCLMAGLSAGCVNAWLWVSRENALNRDYKQEKRREYALGARDGEPDGDADGGKDGE